MDLDSRYVIRKRSALGRVLKVVAVISAVLAALYGIYKLLDRFAFGKKEKPAAGGTDEKESKKAESFDADAEDVLNSAEAGASDDE